MNQNMLHAQSGTSDESFLIYNGVVWQKNPQNPPARIFMVFDCDICTCPSKLQGRCVISTEKLCWVLLKLDKINEAANVITILLINI